MLLLEPKPQRRILGLMSGTSLDGVDLGLVHVQGSGRQTQFELEYFVTLKYPESLQNQIQTQTQDASSSVQQICTLHIELGQFYAQKINQSLAQWKVCHEEVDCIASHGQTLFHAPQQVNWEGKGFHATLQIGDADQISAQTGILTISDFRTKDLAVGGQGAPLLPYIDVMLYQHPNQHRVLHNLGGISNLCSLPSLESSASIVAFDTGPANVLINLAMQHFYERDQDDDGKIAASGEPCAALLNELLLDPYFETSLPKSTGREYFGEEYLAQVLSKAQAYVLSPEDIVATLTALTAHSISIAYSQLFNASDAIEVYFSGGGVHNITLMQMLQELLPYSLKNFDVLGMPADAREVISFALLANELLSGNRVSFPGITGAQSSQFLGKLSLP